MIVQLEINSLSKEKLEMYELTNNVIILFNNSELKNKFVKEFMKIKLHETDVNGNDINYATAEDNEAEIKYIMEYLPTTILKVDDEQRFIFTVESPFVLQCTNPYDLWFCDINAEGEIELYALTDFENYKTSLWDEDICKVYKRVIQGKCGCYEDYGK